MWRIADNGSVDWRWVGAWVSPQIEDMPICEACLDGQILLIDIDMIEHDLDFLVSS